jgi:hypothetical protein
VNLVLDTGDRGNGINSELDGLGRHLNVVIKTANNGCLGSIATLAVTSSEEAIDVDDILEETPPGRHLASLAGL